jgi:uncharacterized membrane protein (DUF485 family)
MLGFRAELEQEQFWNVAVPSSPADKSSEGVVMPQDVKAQPPSTNEWDRIAARPEFQDLIATKKIFIIPAFVFFVVYYFALPVLVGYAPKFMSIKVIGNVNLAYLFALSQFFMAWIIAWLYVKAAGDFDKLAHDIVEESRNGKGGK